jgi:uncharacterized protein YjbI with pentapeptide repeats
MANEEHLKILKQGVEVWNEWRRENFETKPDLCHATLKDADLKQANLTEANLTYADFSSADLSYAYLIGSDVDNAIFRDANLFNANLSQASFTEAKLIHAYLKGADCRQVDFRGSSLNEANLTQTNLYHADLSGADLTGAKIISTYLGGVRFNGANFSNAEIGWSNFGNSDLRGIQAIDSVVHIGPSTIGIDTLYESGGNIPEAFLRGCGVPDEFITYARSLIGKAIDFYSCFISYSSKNQAFAERLYADLQNKGVRCWFAPEDLKIGDKFRQRIDESIRLHDKLLLILSEQSISSPWVEEEVESAMERERKENRLVLFPVRMDDSVMGSSQA